MDHLLLLRRKSGMNNLVQKTKKMERRQFFAHFGR